MCAKRRLLRVYVYILSSYYSPIIRFLYFQIIPSSQKECFYVLVAFQIFESGREIKHYTAPQNALQYSVKILKTIPVLSSQCISNFPAKDNMLRCLSMTAPRPDLSTNLGFATYLLWNLSHIIQDLWASVFSTDKAEYVLKIKLIY